MVWRKVSFISILAVVLMRGISSLDEVCSVDFSGKQSHLKGIQAINQDLVVGGIYS